MRFLKTLAVALAIPTIALQASDIPYYYDYGYPPPAGYMGSFGTVVVGAEWLYMKPTVDENYFSEKTIYTPGASGCVSRAAPCPKWDSGFRVHVGFDLPCDQWTLDASYLYFWTKAAGSDAFTNNFPSINPGQTVTQAGGIVPVLFNDVLEFFDGDYSSNGFWKWQYNQLDIDFSRVSFINRAVSITPRAGFRFIWSEQRLDTAFAFVPSGGGGDGITVGTFNKNDFNGFGLKFGVDSTWDIGFCGLSLYGNFDYSVLLARAQLRQDLALTQTIVPNTPPLAQNLTFKSCPRTLKQMATMAFGLQWLTDFDCDESHLVVRAGWEYIFLSGFNMLIAREASDFTVEDFSVSETVLPISHTLRGDMGLYGLVLGADFYF